MEDDAPGAQGLMLAEVWPTGAAYAWETDDRRLCWASLAESGSSTRACASEPLTPPVKSPKGVVPLATLFTDGWVRLFAADHQEVTSATCDGTPLKVRRVDTVAGGARMLYAVRFTDYTTGNITLRLNYKGTTSETSFSLGDIGDRTCAETL